MTPYEYYRHVNGLPPEATPTPDPYATPTPTPSPTPVPTPTPAYVNMLSNGDFPTGSITPWDLYNKAPAASSVAVASGEASFVITNGGSAAQDIMFRRTGVLIENGATYEIRFKARANAPRTIEVEVGMNASPYTSYSGPYASFCQAALTSTMTEFVYTFTMTGATDNNSRFRFRLGGSTEGVFIDDIVLYKK